MSTNFDEYMAGRSADDYAEFLYPHLTPELRVLDVGCGGGSITLGIAEKVGSVVGIDLSDKEFRGAEEYARVHGIGGIELRTGNVYELDFSENSFDACLCHSVVETLDRPHDALLEVKRVLKPGGVLAVSDVEYGGFIVGGPQASLLRRSYSIREQLWSLGKTGNPYCGRELRGLLNGAGFDAVAASSKYLCYGTQEEVRTFGARQVSHFQGCEFTQAAQEHGLTSMEELKAMTNAWLEWSDSPAAFAAFAWGRAVGFKPKMCPTRIDDCLRVRRSHSR